MQEETILGKTFVQRYLPWLVAAIALVVYGITLNHWASLNSLPTIAQVNGLDWRPVHQAPLHFLLIYPFRWLPFALRPVALNLLAAVCASLTLALLARCIMILPHDRTRDQRSREQSDYSFLTIKSAWLPPVLAVLACGLQLTFWEHAVAETGELLDLLIFAYCIRCLLEFRIELRDPWLTRMAFVYGLGMANNVAMIGFFPAFVLALFWIKGLSVFNIEFYSRMVLWGLGGLSLYLVLPIMHALSGQLDIGFWESLRGNLGAQKLLLLDFPRSRILIFAFTSVLPVLFIGIRWPATFTDISAWGNLMTNVMTHVLHAVFLVACVAMVFDPVFSPRNLGFGYPFLPFYFLGALSVGYYSGYFLLVFGKAPAKTWERRSGLRKVLDPVVVGVIWFALLAVPARLIYTNLPQMRSYNSLDLKQFGEAAAQMLPPQGAVLMCDDSLRLNAVHTATHRNGTGNNYIFIDTGSMVYRWYQSHLRRKYGSRWPEVPKGPARQAIDSLTLMQLVMEASKSLPVYYLHPSFGYYFEQFYAVPHGLVHELRAYPSNTVTAPVLTSALSKENEEYWRRLDDENLKRLVQTVKQTSEVKRLTQANSTPLLVGAFYACALNYWGVELQRSGQLESAGKYFDRALQFNPENPCAVVNLEFNRHLRAGGKGSILPSDDAKKRLAPYRYNWEAIMNVNGPMDEPVTRYLLSDTFVTGGNNRQAAQQILRALELIPGEIEFEIALANLYVPAGFADKSLELISQIRSLPDTSALTLTNRLRLLQAEAVAYYAKNDFAKAEGLLRDAQDKHPRENVPFEALTQIYFVRATEYRRQNNSTAYMGELTNMMANLERQLRYQTNNFNALSFYGALKTQLKDYDTAILNLDRALKLQPENLPVRLNRAIANWQSGNLEEAEKDYLTLENLLPKPLHSIYFGLAEIAYQRGYKKKALMYYQKYLKYAPAGAPEMKYVVEKIKALKKSGTD